MTLRRQRGGALIVGLLLSLVFAAIAAIQVAAWTADAVERTTHQVVPGPVSMVQVDGGAGDILVVPTSGDDVRIDSSAKGALHTPRLRAVKDGRTPEERLTACTLLGTLAVLVVVGTFDAVLLLPVPALIAWSLLGALSPPSRERKVVTLNFPLRVLALLVVAAVGGIALVRSTAQLSAMSIFSTTSRASQLERAAALDPGSYRIHVRLADGYARRGSCARVRSHALVARELFPNAPQPKRLLRDCAP